MPAPLLPGAPLLAVSMPFWRSGACKGVPCIPSGCRQLTLHDLTQYNEEMDRKVNKTCPELDDKWQLQDSYQSLVGSMHDTELLPFRSEQTSFLSARWDFLLSN